jgi:hypothetical protein
LLLSSWIPVCPDCGYAVRGLPAPRCPECGIEFPSTCKTYRRWAFRRVAWDRVKRGPALSAYLRTLGLTLFLPWRAARGLALPDHWHRCLRWSVAHLVIVTLVCASLANGEIFVQWVVEQVLTLAFDPPHLQSLGDVSCSRMLVWFSQSFTAWVIAILFPVGLASLLSIGIPGRHRAAKLGGIKWSLYLSSLYLVIVAAWYGYYYVNPPQSQEAITFTYALPMPGPPTMLLASAYGAWWAAGMAANPYNRVRTPIAFFGFTLLYVGSWAIMTWVLFPAGALDALL